MKKEFLVSLIIFVLFAIAVSAHLIIKHKNTANTSNHQLQAPIEIPDVGIVRYQQAHFKKPAAIMFYVDWCTYCRRFMPMFGEAAKKYGDKFEFIVVNCEYPENETIVKEFGISGFPSLFIVDKDLDFQYQPGISSMESSEAYQKELDKHLKLRKKLKR